MILRMDYFTIKCDNCGKLYADEYSGFSAWDDADGAMEYANESDWITEDNNHYCPDCYEYDDDDNLTIKPIPEIQICYKTNESCKHDCKGLCKESF